MKIKDGGGRRIEFKKCQYLSVLDEDIFRQSWWTDASRPCADYRIEQKSKPEVNSRDVIRLSAHVYSIALPTNKHV